MRPAHVPPCPPHSHQGPGYFRSWGQRGTALGLVPQDLASAQVQGCSPGTCRGHRDRRSCGRASPQSQRGERDCCDGALAQAEREGGAAGTAASWSRAPSPGGGRGAADTPSLLRPGGPATRSGCSRPVSAWRRLLGTQGLRQFPRGAQEQVPMLRHEPGWEKPQQGLGRSPARPAGGWGSSQAPSPPGAAAPPPGASGVSAAPALVDIQSATPWCWQEETRGPRDLPERTGGPRKTVPTARGWHGAWDKVRRPRSRPVTSQPSPVRATEPHGVKIAVEQCCSLARR